MVDPPTYRAEPDPEFADRLERLLLQRLTAPVGPRRRARIAMAPDGSDPAEARSADANGPRCGELRNGRSDAGSRTRQLALGVAAAVVLVAVLGAVLRRDDGTPVDVSTTPRGPSGSLGAGWFAFAAGPFGQADIFLVREGEEPRRVDLPGSDTYHEVCPAFAPPAAAPGSGAQRLMVGRATRDDAELVIVEVAGDGSVSSPLTVPLEGLGGVPCAIWSPDGNWAALGGGGAVWVVNTNSGEARQLSGYAPTDLEWRPGTDELAITGQQARREDPATDAPVDIYSVSTGEIRTLGAAGAVHLTWSPDGSTLAFTHGEDQHDSGIWLVDADGTDERQLTKRLGQVLHGTGVTWSPNGDVIAYQRCEDLGCSGEGHEIVLVTATTDEPDEPIGTETVLPPSRTGTTPSATRWRPYNIIWSPDGTRLLAFAWGSVEGAVIAIPVESARSPIIINDDLGAAIGTDDLGVYDGTPWIPLQPWSRPAR